MRPGSYLPICSLKCRTMREITMQPKNQTEKYESFSDCKKQQTGEGRAERERQGWHHRLHIRNGKVERETRNHNKKINK